MKRDIPPDQLPELSDEELRELLAEVVTVSQEDRKQNAILYYQPASSKAQTVHDTAAKMVGIGGGNGSSKTETALVEMIMCATGIFPNSQKHLIKQKFKGPIQCRMVVESLTTTLEPIILPKLMWHRWTGVDQQGGKRGHWGWIPKNCLIDGDWQKSFSQKLRVLRVLCRDPENPDKILGESSIQFMSKDQDPSDFASGDFHFILHDEPPSLAIFRENEARTMRVDGRIFLAMTWPDDPSINVDWLYNEVYEPGRTGSNPDIAWFELWTTENKNLKQEAVASQASKWGQEITDVRIYGRPIRFSNRIHPEFTDTTKTWCFTCGKPTIPVPQEFTIEGIKQREVCQFCQSEKIAEYNHVKEFDNARNWPVIFLIDPHPRKKHCLLWVQISPYDDWYVIAESQVDGDCVDVRKEVDRIESEMELYVVQRYTDPNMGMSPASHLRVSGRPLTWVDEFRAAGLNLDLAQDSEVGRSRINTMLKPDIDTLQPRLFVHSRCRDTIYQIQRYVWDNFSTRTDRDVKQVPKDKYSDFPTLLKYLANAEPDFRSLKGSAPVLHRPGTRKGSY